MRAVPWNCRTCTKEQKKVRGCIRPTPKKKPILWKICECWVCQGGNTKCKICHGSNIVSLHRCPHALAREKNVARLLPLFIAFRDYGHTPTGGPILKQAVSFLRAAELFNHYAAIYEKQLMARLSNGGTA